MQIDEMLMVGGSDIPVMPGLYVHQPRIKEIWASDVGEQRYKMYVNLFSMTIDELFAANEEIPKEILGHLHVFDVLTSQPPQCSLLRDALNFFLCDTVEYMPAARHFQTTSGVVIDRDVFSKMQTIVLPISCMAPPEDEHPTFTGEKAKRIFEKITAGRKKFKKAKMAQNPSLAMPNVIAKLSAKSPTYNLLNIGELTVWQLYDQFASVCLNTQMDIAGVRWAAWGKEDFDYSLWYTKHD